MDDDVCHEEVIEWMRDEGDNSRMLLSVIGTADKAVYSFVYLYFRAVYPIEK